MAISKGKQFEQKFRECWNSTVYDSWCYRLNDQVSGYMGSSNVCDFICYKYPYIYLIDCKSHEGNTIGFGSFSQYDKMLPYKDVTGLKAGTVIWFIDKDAVVWVPITTWEKIKLEGGKSFNYNKMIDNPEYECFQIASVKKRTYMYSDYSTLIDYYKEQDA